jgi:hypothetical protein
MNKNPFFHLIILAAFLLQACGAAVASPTPLPNPVSTMTVTFAPPTPTPLPSNTPTPTLTPTPAPAPVTNRVSGMTFDTGYIQLKDPFKNPITDQQLINVIKPMGVNWVAIQANCFAENAHDPQVKCDEVAGSPSDAALVHIIQLAKAQGLRVFLKTALILKNSQISLEYTLQNEPDWQIFFSTYGAGIIHWASLAAANGVDLFSVGTEMDLAQKRSDDWRKLIHDVRAVYFGPVTYGANSGGGETGVQWWDALDFIGVDTYYSLRTSNDHPSVEEIKKAWTPYVTLLEGLAKKWDKPIIFTEAGYTSENGTLTMPWGERYDQPIDLQEQADGYQALLETFSEKPWWHGVFWFHEPAMPTEGGPAGQFWEIDGKPAENVLRAYNGQPPFPTYTPIPTFDAPPSAKQVIYADGLGQNWEFPSIFTWADLNSTEQVFAGQTAVKVTTDPWTGISFWVDPAADLSPYNFLEFYIYIASNKGEYYPNINVNFNDASGDLMLSMPDIMRPGYVEGGELTLGKWQRVRIPLTELGAVNQKVRTLSFSHHSKTGTVVFYLDNISLVKFGQ